MNGVGHEGMATATPVTAAPLELENPNISDVPREDRPGSLRPEVPQLQQPPDSVDPPYGVEPHQGASVLTTNERTFQPGGQPTSTPTSSTMRVQEFYSAASGQANAEAQGVRWMARFTEFLRVAATRGANGMDRVLDGLGLPPPAPARERRVTSTTVSEERLNLSPPEPLPSPHEQVPAIPISWSPPPALEGPPAVQEPLFQPHELAQMQRSQMEFPLIYGRSSARGQGSEGDSDRSSRLQAEVHKQLEEYKARQQREVEKLQKEIQQLRAERAQERATQQYVQDRPVPQSHGVPEGNQGHQPGHEVPQSRVVPEGNLQNQPS